MFRSTTFVCPTSIKLPGLICFALILLLSNRSQADEPMPVIEPLTVDKYLDEGTLADAEEALNDAIAADGNDQQAKFALGVVKVFQAVERLGQSQYKYGLLANRRASIPFLRLPVPTNGSPEEIGYEESRAHIATFVNDLATAEKALAAVDSTSVILPLDLDRIKLDLRGDGKEEDKRSVWQIVRVAMPGMRAPKDKRFVINFDGGDVHWLRGYCHLLMFFGESMLAYDWQDTFERTAHLFYPKPKTPYPFLQEETPVASGQWNSFDFVDLIAFIHTINFPVAEPKRMEAALGHIEEVIEQSKVSWKLILAETDDDREWIPNPKQTGVIPNIRVTEEMIGSWHTFLDEFESIVKGETLIPFWRGGPRQSGFQTPAANPKLGINFRKIFTNPQRFDMVLWIQGTAAAPFLEEGKITDPAVWRNLQGVFRGRFWGFAIWFN